MGDRVSQSSLELFTFFAIQQSPDTARHRAVVVYYDAGSVPFLFYRECVNEALEMLKLDSKGMVEVIKKDIYNEKTT